MIWYCFQELKLVVYFLSVQMRRGKVIRQRQAGSLASVETVILVVLTQSEAK